LEKNLVDIQTNLFLQKRYVRAFNTHTADEIVDMVLKYSKKYDTFILLIYFEIIFDTRDFKKIEDCINSLPNKIWIMSTTTSRHPLYVEPIVNLLVWKEQLIDEIYDNEVYVPAFPNYLWENKTYNLDSKKNKSILSLRRRNLQRDLFYHKLKDGDLTIKRYHYKEPQKEYPTWEGLIQEYKETFVAVVCETTYPSWTETTCMTEKSILSFLCGNIPLILGKKKLIKELHEMGFWTANYDFGFTERMDLMDDFSQEKINGFVGCVKKINQIDIEQYYKDNLDKINNNYKIIHDSFMKKYLL
jgi:hypothetical protein